MRGSQTTIKDIARKLKISPSTVSRALKNHPDISPETKAAVAALAKQLDYQPNAIASSLRRQKTNIIGVIIPELAHHFFSTVISGIEEVSHEAGYQVMICQSGESFERELNNVQTLLSSRVDGILLSLSEETNAFDHLNHLLRKEVPLVLFDRINYTINVNTVAVNDREAAYKAVRHLLQSGFQNIAHLGGLPGTSIADDRYHGYRDALVEFGIALDEEMHISSSLTQQGGVASCRELLNKARQGIIDLPDAIFAVTDPVALGAMTVIKEAGLSIPEDIAMVGFSNDPFSPHIDPPLTTVAQPGRRMGIRAAEMLIEQINSPHASVRHEILPTELIIRSSSLPKAPDRQVFSVE